MLYTDFFLFILAFMLSYILFTPTMLIAWSIGAIDLPGKRKIHRYPTARLGGLSMILPFCLLILPLSASIEYKLPLILGSVIIFFIGSIDDISPISPIAKLTGQACAASVYVLSTELIGGSKPMISHIFEFIWIIFICNAINLSDGLDGLAGSLTASALLCLSVSALFLGSHDAISVTLLLLFAVLGFLPHNISPAKIFMGDCGSLFLGFVLGVISSHLISESKNIPFAIGTMIILFVPLSDTVYSFLRRLVRGKNPLKADRGHFHHRLLDLGFSSECAALSLICASLFFGLVGILVCAVA